MYQLITGALNEGSVSVLFQFPETLLKKNEKELIQWIATYYRKYSKAPSISRVQREFPSFVPIQSSDPLQDLLEQAVKERQLNYADYISNQVIAAETLDEKLNLINQGTRVLNQSSTEIGFYTKFDRSEYFAAYKTLDFPYPMIQQVTGGLHGGEYLTLFGRLGSGKTTIACDMVKHWVLQGKRILFITTELTPIDVFLLFDAMFGEFNPLIVRNNEQAQFNRLKPKLESAVSGLTGEIIVPKTQVSTLSAIATHAANYDVDAVVIDGVYLLKSESTVQRGNWEKIQAISQQVKQDAISLGIPYICITQAKRESAGKDEFDSEDIAFSDAPGQDSTFAIGIKPELKPGKLQLQMVKNRRGPLMVDVVTVDYKTYQIEAMTVGSK